MKAILCKEGFYVVFKCHAHGTHLVEALRWHFNNNLDKPTISASVRHYAMRLPGSTVDRTHCHYSIADGVIQYHGDCPHAFADKTLELLDFTEDEIEHFKGEGYR